MIEKFIPNEFDFKILCFHHGYIRSSEVIKTFLDYTFFLPSTMTNENDKQNFICPNMEGEMRVALFTSKRLLYFSASLMKASYKNPKINSCIF